jgi:nicotinamidase-related amidase
MNKILVVVDMQNDFIDGTLGSDRAKKIVPKVVQKIKNAKDEGWNVIFTMDTHSDDYLATSEGKKLPVVHCVKGTHGWQLNESIAPLSQGCDVYEKGTFGSVKLAKDIAGMSPKEIEIVGLCTDICVVSNAILIKATLPECKIGVCESCCAGATEAGHRAAIETMRCCQIDIV